MGGWHEDRRPPLPALTGIRALAAYGPILWHSQHFADRLLPVARHGYLGVDFFFMLSGFVLAYVHGSAMQRPQLVSYGRFIGLRLGRIWPAYAAVLLAVGAALVWRERWWVDPLSAKQLRLVLHLLMLQSWGLVDANEFNWPAWSVSAEWFVYLLFPLFAVVLGRAGRRVALPAIPLLAVVLALVFALAGFASINAVGAIALWRAGIEFAMGFLLWRLFVDQAVQRWNWGWIGAASLILLAALLAFSPSQSRGDFLFLPVFAPLLLSLAFDRGPLARICRWRSILFLGEASYSIYLVHWPLLFKIAGWLEPQRGALPPWAFALLGMAATVLLSTVAGIGLHLLVERPCRRWVRHRLGYEDA